MFAIAIFTGRCPAPCSVQSSKTISPPLTFVTLQCASKRFTTPFPSASIFLPGFFRSPVLVSLCFLLCIFFHILHIYIYILYVLYIFYFSIFIFYIFFMSFLFSSFHYYFSILASIPDRLVSQYLGISHGETVTTRDN